MPMHTIATGGGDAAVSPLDESPIIFPFRGFDDFSEATNEGVLVVCQARVYTSKSDNAIHVLDITICDKTDWYSVSCIPR